MRKISIILILILGTMLPSALFAQSNNDENTLHITRSQKDTTAIENDSAIVLHRVTLIARNYGDSIVLRWAPHEGGIWRLTNIDGWTITRMGGNKVGADSTTFVTLNNGQPIKPLTLEQMQQRFTSSDLQAGAVAQMLYGATWVTGDANSEDGFMDYVFHQDQEQGQRQAITYMMSDCRADLADAAGLRFVDRDIEPGETYHYFLSSQVDPAYVAVESPSVLTSPIAFKRDSNYTVPQLHFEQVDAQRALIYWKRNSLTGYFVERSTNGGKWELLSDLPTYPTNPDEETRQVFGKEISNIMVNNVVFMDSLALNNTYRYRVRGYDAFADYCDYTTMKESYKMVDIIAPSNPIITSVTPKDNKTCTIKWIKDSIEGDLKGYVLTFAHKSEGPWSNVSGELSPNTFTYLDPDAGDRGPGYYRLFAVDTAGNASFSQASGNNIADLVAPKAPTNLHGQGDYLFDTISTPNGDSLGLSSNAIIALEWNPVDAYDLLGYRVFYANSRNAEYHEASSTVSKNLFFFDTINASTLTPYIYYYVIAVDERYNYSVPSDTIAIRTPDIVQPGACVLVDLHQTDDSVYITWTKSASEDVEQYFIYRRSKGSKRWSHLRTIPAVSLNEKSQINFTDCPPRSGQAYQYCIEAIDSSELSSGRYGFANVYIHSPRHAEVKMKLDAKRDKKSGHVNLSWKYDYRGELEHFGVIYRSVDGSDFNAIASFNEGDTTYTDASLPANSSAQYYIVLKLGNNCTTNPSNTVNVK